MMLTIHGLPKYMKYKDVKKIIFEQCGLADYILDNLVADGMGMKVRIGVADESEGMTLMRRLDNFQINGNHLSVRPIGKAMDPNQSQNQGSYNAPPQNNYNQPQNNYNQQSNFVGQDRPDPWGPPPSERQDPWGPIPGASPMPQSQYQPNFQQQSQSNYQSYQQPNMASQSNSFVPQHQQQRPQQGGFGQREMFPDRPQQQNFGYQQKNMGPVEPMPNKQLPTTQPLQRPMEMAHPAANRSLERPGYGGPDKPMTIAKDNFQGPGEFAPYGQRHGPYRDEHASKSSPWDSNNQQTQQQSYKPSPVPFGEKRQFQDKPSYNDDKNREVRGAPRVPEGFPRRNEPPGRDSLGRRDNMPTGRDFDPNLRRDSPFGGNADSNMRRGPIGKDIDPHFDPNVRRGPMGKDIDPHFDPNVRRGPIGKDIEPHFDPNDRRGPIGKDIDPPFRRDGPPIRDMDPPIRRNDPFGKDMETHRRDGPPARDIDPQLRRSDAFTKDIALQSRGGPPQRDFEPNPRGDAPPGRIDPFGKDDPHLGRDGPSRPVDPQSRRGDPFGNTMDSFSRKDDFRKVESPYRRDDPVPRDGGRGPRDDHVRRMSPRRVSPGGRRLSPSPMRKRFSPGRRLSPGRHVSPGRRASPGRQMSPGRRVSPGRHLSPRRRMSPTRRASPATQYPPRAFNKSPEPYVSESRIKQVRPAYEPPSQAPKKDIYTGSFRPNINENVQYPIPGQQGPSWQERDKYVPSKKPEDGRRDFARPFESQLEPKANRLSRSPHRRDRSPIKDRFKKHSPSPRSPRRSWALEKRRSPNIHDAPPPPSWPGQEIAPSRGFQEEKRTPIWETEGKKERSRFDDSPRSSDVWKTRNDKFSRKEDFGREPPRREDFAPSTRRPEPIDEFRLDDDYPKREKERGYGKPDGYRESPKEFSRHDDYKKREDHRKEGFSSFEDRKEKYREPDAPRSSRFDEKVPGTEPEKRISVFLPANVKVQHDMAVEMLQERLSQKHDLQEPLVRNELRLAVSMKLKKLCGVRDLSAHDMLVRFDQKYSSADCDDIFREVVSCLPRQYRQKKEEKPAPFKPVEQHDAPAKPTSKEQLKEMYKRTVEEIRRRILIKQNFRPSNELFKRVCEELTMTLLKTLLKFGEKYGPSCDIQSRYELTYSAEDEDRMFADIVEKVRAERKRPATDAPDVPAKFFKTSSDGLKHSDNVPDKAGTVPAGQDTALKQKAVNSNPVTVSAPPVRYAGAPPKPTAQPSPVKKAPVKAVPPVKKTPAAVSTAAKDNPTVVKIAQTKATETANADDIKFKHPAKILSVKSVTQINNSPSEKVTAPVKISSQSTPTKDVNKTGPTTGAKATPTKSVSSKEVTATKGVAATKTPAEKVSPGAKTPAEKVTLTAKAPAEKVCPLANSAQEVTPGNKSTETVTPATKTGEKDSPTAAKPAVNVTPVAAKTADKVTPVAAKMADKVTPAAKAAEKVTQETATKATPAAKSTPTKPEAKVDAKEMDVDKIKASEKTGIVKKEDPKPLRKLTPDYSQAMAEELELIMIKIWENLPKDTTSDAEKAAIETYRNDAGDELRNALELGVKQRLLNIHNELNIKVTLEERPSPKWLSTFKRKFRALSMHRVPGDKNSFVAEIGCFKDFDKLYSANRTKLGGMKVSLEPVYNFIREPNELRRLENLERKKTRHLTSSKKTATDRGSYNEDTGSLVDESMEEDESLDLFSMLEGGIVLDECMGSDDEE